MEVAVAAAPCGADASAPLCRHEAVRVSGGGGRAGAGYGAAHAMVVRERGFRWDPGPGGSELLVLEGRPHRKMQGSSWHKQQQQQQRGTAGGSSSVRFEQLCEAGRLDEAMDALLSMEEKTKQQDGTSSRSIASCYMSLLRACGRRKSLAHAKRLHAHLATPAAGQAARSHHLLPVVVHEYLVTVLAKCGAPDAALPLFHALPRRSVYSWTALMDAYAASGRPRAALALYARMRREEGAVLPDAHALVSAVRAAAGAGDLPAGRAAHADARARGCAGDLFVGSALVSMYAKCGAVGAAAAVFAELPRRDAVSWNAMLAAYAQRGDARAAVAAYIHMRRGEGGEGGVSPNDRTFVSVVHACGAGGEQAAEGEGEQGGKLEWLGVGRAVHASARARGADGDGFVVNALISMYGKCGAVGAARAVFDGSAGRGARNGVAWNAMLAAYAQQQGDVGAAAAAVELYVDMVASGEGGGGAEEGGDLRSVVSLVQACGTLAQAQAAGAAGESGEEGRHEWLARGKGVHAHCWRRGGADSDVFVGNTLVSMYGKCGAAAEARAAFARLAAPNVVSWNAVLVACAEAGAPGAAWGVYEDMVEQGVSPDAWTLVAALSAAVDVAGGGRCQQDGAGGAGGGDGEQQQHHQLLLEDTDAAAEDDADLLLLQQRGKALHARARQLGLDADPVVGNTLVRTYGKCGSLRDLHAAFAGLPRPRTVVAWTSLLAAHVARGAGARALRLYAAMRAEGVRPDHVSLLCVLQACSGAGCLQLCRRLHQDIIIIESGSGAGSDTAATPTPTSTTLPQALGNTLVHAYGRCGSMADAQAVFDSHLPRRDVVSWNALLAGYARAGCYATTLHRFHLMLDAAAAADSSVKPNSVTLVTMLAACNHAGLVEAGEALFADMLTVHGVTPAAEHHACVADMLARAGHLRRAERVAAGMPGGPDLAVALGVLAACRTHLHGDDGEQAVEVAERAFGWAVAARPRHAAAYVMMAGVYAARGMWEAAREVRAAGGKAGAWAARGRRQGRSWLEEAEDGREEVVMLRSFGAGAGGSGEQQVVEVEDAEEEEVVREEVESGGKQHEQQGLLVYDLVAELSLQLHHDDHG